MKVPEHVDSDEQIKLIQSLKEGEPVTYEAVCALFSIYQHATKDQLERVGESRESCVEGILKLVATRSTAERLALLERIAYGYLFREHSLLRMFSPF